MDRNYYMKLDSDKYHWYREIVETIDNEVVARFIRLDMIDQALETKLNGLFNDRFNELAVTTDDTENSVIQPNIIDILATVNSKGVIRGICNYRIGNEHCQLRVDGDSRSILKQSNL